MASMKLLELFLRFCFLLLLLEDRNDTTVARFPLSPSSFMSCASDTAVVPVISRNDDDDAECSWSAAHAVSCKETIDAATVNFMVDG
jgi:hypothetical protein